MVEFSMPRTGRLRQLLVRLLLSRAQLNGPASPSNRMRSIPDEHLFAEQLAAMRVRLLLDMSARLHGCSLKAPGRRPPRAIFHAEYCSMTTRARARPPAKFPPAGRVTTPSLDPPGSSRSQNGESLAGGGPEAVLVG